MAAPILTPQQLGDLQAMTIRDLSRGKFTEIATDIQEHTAMPRLMKKGRVDIKSGTGVQWDVKVTHAGSAANVGMGAQDDVNIVDTMVQATADWRMTTVNWAYLADEVAMNEGEAQIIDLIKSRYFDAQIALAELMESNFWGPPVALSDLVTPWGINTWIVKNATEGFNGGVPSGYTTIGLNPTTYPRWSNWTCPYTAVSKDDLILGLRKAARKTGFKPPVQGMPTFNQMKENKYGQYTNLAVIQAMESLLESQNEDLGNDIASKDGNVIFRNAPVEWVPFLDRDTTNPFYGLNWGEFQIIFLRNWFMRITKVPVYPGQHLMSATFADTKYQFVQRNRRSAYVASNGTSYPS